MRLQNDRVMPVAICDALDVGVLVETQWTTSSTRSMRASRESRTKESETQEITDDEREMLVQRVLVSSSCVDLHCWEWRRLARFAGVEKLAPTIDPRFHCQEPRRRPRNELSTRPWLRLQEICLPSNSDSRRRPRKSDLKESPNGWESTG